MRWRTGAKEDGLYVCLKLDSHYEVKYFLESEANKFDKYVAVYGPFTDVELPRIFMQYEVKMLIRESWRVYRNRISCVRLARMLLGYSLRDAKYFADNEISKVKGKLPEPFKTEEQKQFDRFEQIVKLATMLIDTDDPKKFKEILKMLKQFVDYNVAYNAIATLSDEKLLRDFIKKDLRKRRNEKKRQT